jgi:hypothetical protein
MNETRNPLDNVTSIITKPEELGKEEERSSLLPLHPKKSRIFGCRQYVSMV